MNTNKTLVNQVKNTRGIGLSEGAFLEHRGFFSRRRVAFFSSPQLETELASNKNHFQRKMSHCMCYERPHILRKTFVKPGSSLT